VDEKSAKFPLKIKGGGEREKKGG